MIFFQLANWDRDNIWTNKKFVFFFNYSSWEKFVEKNSWTKLVKASDEFVIGQLKQSVGERWRKLAIIFLTLHHASGSTFYGTEYANRLESLMNLSSTCIWAASGYALIRQATSIKGIVLSITYAGHVSCMYYYTFEPILSGNCQLQTSYLRESMIIYTRSNLDSCNFQIHDLEIITEKNWGDSNTYKYR